MTGPTLWLPTPMTARRRVEAEQARGRPSGRTPGGWVADFVGLKKSVALCAACDPKWQPKRHAYLNFNRGVQVHDTCDGCQVPAICKIFVHESVIEQVGRLPRRRAGRWGTNLGWMPQWIRG